MMKKLFFAAACLASALALQADSYNQNITAIFGSGNPNGGWTTDTGYGITLGLRAKNRDNGATPNVNGVYSFATGYNSNNTRALWNYEFSINSGTPYLSYFDYYLGIDMDSSAGINQQFVNPFAVYGDNAYGNTGTGNGMGTVGSGALAGTNFVAQNSQNIIFLGFDPMVSSTFDYVLYAVSKGAGAEGQRLAEVSMTVVVGNGGAAVPDAGSTSLLIALGVMGLVGFRAGRR